MPIVTSRLRLRPITHADAHAIAAGHAPAGLSLSKGYPSEFTAEVMDMVLNHDDAQGAEYGPLFMIRRDDHTVIGDLGCHVVPERREGIAGYSVAEPLSGRGYATEALHGLLQVVLRDPRIDRVVAQTFVDHVASRRVMEKAGMTQYAVELGEVDGRRTQLVKYEAHAFTRP